MDRPASNESTKTWADAAVRKLLVRCFGSLADRFALLAKLAARGRDDIRRQR